MTQNKHSDDTQPEKRTSQALLKQTQNTTASAPTAIPPRLVLCLALLTCIIDPSQLTLVLTLTFASAPSQVFGQPSSALILSFGTITVQGRSAPAATPTLSATTSRLFQQAQGNDIQRKTATNGDNELQSTGTMSNDTRHSQKDAYDTQALRSAILEVGVKAGRLCHVANLHMPGSIADEQPAKDTCTSLSKPEVVLSAIVELLVSLLETTAILELDLLTSVRSKLALNAKKYPVELCKGKAGKYTKYSNVTGVTKDNQSTLDETQPDTNGQADNNDDDVASSGFDKQTMSQTFVGHIRILCDDLEEFAVARLWSKYHLPRNIVLALLGEVGELAEVVQWHGDEAASTVSLQERDKLSQELADVTIYLLRLTTVVGLASRLEAACQEKVA